MPERYDLGWLHERAARLQFGSLLVRLDVRDRRITAVEIIEGRERRTLEDVRPRSAESILG